VSGAEQALPGADDPQSDKAILARHRDYFRTVHPDIKAAAMREAEAKRNALSNCQEQLALAIGHLQALMRDSKARREAVLPAGQSAVERAARDWLTSIGSDPKK